MKKETICSICGRIVAQERATPIVLKYDFTLDNGLYKLCPACYHSYAIGVKHVIARLQADIKMKGHDTRKFAKYMSMHTPLSYESAARLYEFCNTMGLSKEVVVEKYGNIECMCALTFCKSIWVKS